MRKNKKKVNVIFYYFLSLLKEKFIWCVLILPFHLASAMHSVRDLKRSSSEDILESRHFEERSYLRQEKEEEKHIFHHLFLNTNKSYAIFNYLYFQDIVNLMMTQKYDDEVYRRVRLCVLDRKLLPASMSGALRNIDFRMRKKLSCIGRGEICPISYWRNMTSVDLSYVNLDPGLLRDLSQFNIVDLSLSARHPEQDAEFKIHVIRDLIVLFPNLKKLSFSESQLTDDEAFEISKIPNLVYLDLSKNRIGAEGARALSKMKHLETLILAGNNIEDRGALAIAEGDAKKLNYLDLSCNGITNIAVKAIAQMESLRELHLSFNSIYSQGARSIAAMKNLVSLSLSKACINMNSPSLEEEEWNADGVRFLQELPQLTYLDLSNNGLTDDAVTWDRSKLPKLTHLDVSNNSISAPGARSLGCMKQLTHLHLANNRIGKQTSTYLDGLDQLVSLDLSNNRIGNFFNERAPQELHQLFIMKPQLLMRYNQLENFGMQSLAKLEKLMYLKLAGNHLDDDHVLPLAQLKQLVDLDLSNNNIRCGSAVSYFDWVVFDDGDSQKAYLDWEQESSQSNSEGSALCYLAQLKRLRKLNVSNNYLGDSGAKDMARTMNHLTSLNLAQNQVGDVGAQAIIHEMKNLTHLNLARNHINSSGVRNIGELGQLTQLNLSDNRLANAGAKCIARDGSRLEKLTHLNLARNGICNDGIQAICTFTQLTHLNLEGNHGDNRLGTWHDEPCYTQMPSLTHFNIKDNKMKTPKNRSEVLGKPILMMESCRFLDGSEF